jgi:AcrR family transcriptional regulator
MPDQHQNDVKAKIVAAAGFVVRRSGLTDWTVESVAKKASCAKGLILYHFGTKAALLNELALRVRLDRVERRIAALSGGGTAALDRLWQVLSSEVEDGTTALWLGLVAQAASRQSASIEESDRSRFSTAAVPAMQLGQDFEGGADLLDALNGFELALLQGRRAELVREGFDRFWLDLLSG